MKLRLVVDSPPGRQFAAGSLLKATVHERVGRPGGPGLWGHKSLQLPAYIQHIANDLREKRGMSESRAIATAIAAVKRWAAGGGNVDAETRAAARKAVAEWEALKAKAKGLRGGKALARAAAAEEHAVRLLASDDPELERLFASRPKSWIKLAIKRKGQLHKDLGVPPGQKIPRPVLEAAARRKGKTGRRARLALTLQRMGVSDDLEVDGPELERALASSYDEAKHPRGPLGRWIHLAHELDQHLKNRPRAGAPGAASWAHKRDRLKGELLKVGRGVPHERTHPGRLKSLLERVKESNRALTAESSAARGRREAELERASSRMTSGFRPRVVPKSGYHAPLSDVKMFNVGAWHFQVGKTAEPTLHKGEKKSWVVEAHSAATARPQRLYFKTRGEAHDYVKNFGGARRTATAVHGSDPRHGLHPHATPAARRRLRRGHGPY